MRPSADLLRQQATAALSDVDLEIAFRTRAVPFPESSDVGACYTQIATRTRPLPMRMAVLDLEFPSEAIAAAEGRAAYFAYERLGRNGYIIRMARCVIPDSPEAVKFLLDRFRLPPGSTGLDEFAGSLPISDGGVDRGSRLDGRAENGPEVPLERLSGAPWRVVGLAAPLVTNGELVASLGGGSCPGDGTANATSPTGFLGLGGDDEGCQCETEWEGNNPTVTCCDNPHHVMEDGFCSCANGSPFGDCWLEDDDDDPFPPCDPFMEMCEDDPPGGGGGGGSGSGGDGGDVEDALNDLVDSNAFALLDTIPCHLIPEWSSLAQTTVDQWIIDRKPGTDLQVLASAAGAVVNMDKYTFMVNMNQVPSSISAVGIFDYIRENLPALTAGAPGTFSYYDPGEAGRWMSSQGPPDGPQGTYFSIDLPWPFSASVVASSFSSGSSWTFSTVSTSQNHSHPVSGHRSFTWTESGGWGTLTIRGVDRVSGPWWGVADQIIPVFDSGDNVWQNFQVNLGTMLGAGGALTSREIYRPDWELLEDILLGNADVESLDGCSP